jgi:hypothetical protein
VVAGEGAQVDALQLGGEIASQFHAMAPTCRSTPVSGIDDRLLPRFIAQAGGILMPQLGGTMMSLCGLP